MFGREAEDLRQMQGLSACSLTNLFATGKSIGDDQGLRGSQTNGGQKSTLPNLTGEPVVVFFKPEGAGHAAAAGFRDLDLQPQAL